MEKFSPGDVISCRVPRTDIAKKIKKNSFPDTTDLYTKRPAVVIKHSDRDVTVVKITKVSYTGSIKIVSPQDLEDGELRLPESYVRFSKIITLEEEESMRKICRLKDYKVRELERELISFVKMT